MKIIYLDYNVISYLRTGNFPKNISPKLKEKVEFIKENYSIAFSPAHLEDIAASKIRCGTSDDVIRSEIEFLTSIAGRNSLRPITRETLKIYYDEYPIDCYHRVVSGYVGNDLIEPIEKKILEDARSNPLSEPKEMNNISPEDIFDQFRKKQISCSLYKQGYLSESEIEKSLNWTFDDIKDKFYIVEAYINLAANLLEKLGYYRESENKYRSRLHDVSHMIYGAYCDVFVSADKKMINKLKAIYSALNIPTEVLSLLDFQNKLDC